MENGWQNRKGSKIMLPDEANKKSKDLLHEISRVIHQWPEQHREIFIAFHYRGQSREAIARMGGLESKEVNKILQQCDRRLYTALRAFRKTGNDKPAPFPLEIARLASCG
jgi:DNA-directed RNA polymerase specialized sigma24 family protein